MTINNRIQRITQRLSEIELEKVHLTRELEQLKMEQQISQPVIHPSSHLKPEEKIALFMTLFRGRTDVFPKRWDNQKTGKSGYSPVCQNEWAPSICRKPKIKCSDCPHQAFKSVIPEVIHKHLTGEVIRGIRQDHTIGVYPMMLDETCWFLAADFDKANWQRDVSHFIKTCQHQNVSAHIERSRSGQGAHVWIFFSEPIPAVLARKMGMALITETMNHYPEIGFESYDRFFPNQDNMPSGGFGNLIALPLQYHARQQGNSVFINEAFEPYIDQWDYLSSLRKMSLDEVSKLVNAAQEKGEILGIRLAIEEEDQKPWEMSPSRKKAEIKIDPKQLPESVEVILSNQVFIAKKGLPSSLTNQLIRLAAFQNPEFYKAQALRFSTFGKSRIIACAEMFPEHIGLPRGCIEDALELFNSLNINVSIEDKRNEGKRIAARFLGQLTSEQKQAVKALVKHDTGILAATTAFGKTVVAAHIIAKRKRNTLILVHRRQLLDQWIEKLAAFLNIPSKQIGIIGGGKRKPTGIIDVAVIQSLVKNHVVDDCIAQYGQLIIDECHHISAVSFEAVAKACKAKYVLGLTATVVRKDGHHPIIFMQCGATRYQVDAKQQASLRAFTHQVISRNTSFEMALPHDEKPTIQALYASLIANEARNQMIVSDVIEALNSGRNPLLLTERKEHAFMLADSLLKHCQHVILMTGGQSAKQRNLIAQQISHTPETENRLLIATGRYIGEGFDEPRLDTLFLTMPISWHGTLAQYAGRLHRFHQHKKEVIIYDYIDILVPMLVKMFEKRRKGYERLGYHFHD